MRSTAIASIVFGLLTCSSAFSEQPNLQVDQIFATYSVAASPGCELGVIRDGNFIYHKGYGEGSLEFGVPLSDQSVFYMGSVSKQFTAASVVVAAEQGHLSLDDDIRKYIPELPDYGHTITLRQMLHHTSGLKDYLSLLAISGRHDTDYFPEQEILDLITRQKSLNYIPGDEYLYSNTNYFLLGIVIRRATGKSLATFATENIFKPLGMSHTRYYDDHTLILPSRVSAYTPGRNGDFRVDWSTNYDLVGGGGLTSTVDDLLLWDRNFYDDKLGGALVKELLTPGLLNDGKPSNYALGLELGTYRGLPIVEHDGAMFGYRTEILRFPEQRFSVITLCNVASADPADLSRKVADVYLKDELQSQAAPSAANGSWPDPALFAGEYLDPRTHLLFSFTTSEGHLVAWGAKLRRLGPYQFNDLGSDIITFHASSGVVSSSLDVDGRTFFSAPKLPPLTIDPAALPEFAGTYNSSEELNASYKLSIDHGHLGLNNNWNPTVTLYPIAKDEFNGGHLGIFVFHRDSSQRISGLSVFTLTARDVSFKK